MGFRWRVCLVSLLSLTLLSDASAAGSAKRGKPWLRSAGGGFYAVRQIGRGSSAHGAAVLAGTADLQPSAAARSLRRPTRDLAEALAEAPNARTAGLLAELGIPAIDGVPPIVFLSPAPQASNTDTP